MDPNAAVDKLREALAAYQANADDPEAAANAASDVVDAAEALDVWLTMGGMPPTEWASYEWSKDFYVIPRTFETDRNIKSLFLGAPSGLRWLSDLFPDLHAEALEEDA